MLKSIPMLISIFGYLLAYAGVVVMMLRRDRHGWKRKWDSLDFVWVPLGGFAGVSLIILWWRTHGPK
jgi:amino acid transporter